MATATASSAHLHTPSHSQDARENGRSTPSRPSDSSSRHHPVENADPMDLSPGSTSVRPSPTDRSTPGKGDAPADDSAQQKTSTHATGAAAAGQQPKIVQTAFIHKLYNMLEDQKIQSLISWSSSGSSFVINPSSEFSKVLAVYFKHGNISSFVRQLNMYGFHKVSDVFSTATPDTPLWEFKHGEGNFKRGDLNGLREIKRRASKHALIHRDSVPAVSKPPAPSHVFSHEQPQDSTDGRINMLEQSLYEVHSRLAKSEESHAIMSARYNDLADRLAVSYQYNHDLSGMLAKIYEDPEHPLRRESQSLQRDIDVQLTNIRTDRVFHAERSPKSVRLFDRSMPASPGQPYYDDRRRASIQTVPRQQLFRPLAPSPQRHGSLGSGGAVSPPTRGLAPPPPPLFQARTPPPVHAAGPAINVQPPFGRRHTSADIHSHMPQVGGGAPAYNGAPHDYTLPHPASPPPFGGDQQIRDKLASYSFTQSKNRGSISHQSSRGPSPPPPQPRDQTLPHPDGNWAQPPAVRMPFRDVFKSGGVNSQNSSAAPTRRSSMANIQAMLNPADTAETEEEHGADDGDEMRKRKRRG